MEKSTYLMWVGSESYPKIADWTEEAVALGISKRLPNAAMAKKLMDAIIYVAHDEGEATDCRACYGVIECGDCRKLIAERARLDTEAKALAEKAAGPTGITGHGNRRLVALRSRSLALATRLGGCSMCSGRGEVAAGTGGHVVLDDGTKMDYRRFNYWLHQPAKRSAADRVVERHMCKDCGGTGKEVAAKLFGLFIPSDIEYILSGTETAAELEKVKAFTMVGPGALIVEKARKCGKRAPGGVYVVAATPKASAKEAKAAKLAVKALVDAGKITPKNVEIIGNFVRFLAPIPIKAKRFRGVAVWSPESIEIASAATDILEAVA